MKVADVLTSSTTMEIRWNGYPREPTGQILERLSTAVGKQKTNFTRMYSFSAENTTYLYGDINRDGFN